MLAVRDLVAEFMSKIIIVVLEAGGFELFVFLDLSYVCHYCVPSLVV